MSQISQILCFLPLETLTHLFLLDLFIIIIIH